MTPRSIGPKQGDLCSLGERLAGIYSRKQWNRQWRLFQLARQWPSIVGADYARLTTPAFFRQQTLWIYVQDSSWMHHLQFVKLDLLARINLAMDDQPVADIRWQLQPQESAPSASRPTIPPTVDVAEAQSFLRIAEGIANPECRTALQRLWRTFAAARE